jgi:hypothetical protein
MLGKLAAKLIQKIVAREVAKDAAVQAVSQAAKAGKPITTAMTTAAKEAEQKAFTNALKRVQDIKESRALAKAQGASPKAGLSDAMQPIKQARDAAKKAQEAAKAAESINAGRGAREAYKKQMEAIAREVTPGKDLAKVLRDFKANGTLTPDMAAKFIAGDPKGLGLKHLGVSLGVKWNAMTKAEKIAALAVPGGLMGALGLGVADKLGKDNKAKTINIDVTDDDSETKPKTAKAAKETPQETMDRVKRESVEEKKKNDKADAKQNKADAKAKDKAKIDKVAADIKAEKEKVKDLDNNQRDKNKASEDAHKDETKAEIDRLKAERDDALANAPKGSKTAIRKEYADKIKTYRDDRKAELATLKVENKAKLDQVKKDAKDRMKNLDNKMFALQGAKGFYTDANGKKRPLTAPKGK